MTNPRKAAMTKAGLGAGAAFVFTSVFLANVAEFWERLAAIAVVGFLVGVVSFIFGQQSK
jgi:hypothetical protein